MPATPQTLLLRQFGLLDYLPVWQAMQDFTAQRGAASADELWLLQHPPIFTLGRNAKPEHLLNPGDIPVQAIDRGGQVTYHGPGQLLGYIMADLKQHGGGVREFVSRLEQAVIDLLAEFDIAAHGRRDAPGVYVGEAKIAALGLRIRRGFSYHGLALNIDMDLSPFQRINPCGYANLPVTQLRDLGITREFNDIARRLVAHLANNLGYNGVSPAESLLYGQDT